ncbi:unnamed protein product, partial [Mesorhabditis spiculigera]
MGLWSGSWLACSLLVLAASHQQCDNAPTRKHQITCERLMSWNNMSKPIEEQRKRDGRLIAKGRLAAGKREPRELGDCMDMPCVARFLTGNKDIKPPFIYKGKELKKVIRKEVRQMTDDEWHRLLAAIQELKDNGVYDEISLVHMSVTEASNAHSGPAFFPWHREYIKRFELELRRIDPELYVPYWDSTLESGLPNPPDSSIWTSELFGNGQGPVNVGPWGRWITDNDTSIQRSVGENGDPFSEKELQKFWEYTDIEMVLSQTGGPQLADRGCEMEMNWDWFELIHGNAHNWIGGDMLTTLYATRDPPFYMHHSFVDLIWETWRVKHQAKQQRETEYPKNKKCMTTLHWPTAVLIPFNKRFAPRPSCAKEKPHCGSRYLFCDLSTDQAPRCVAKAATGGQCTGYKNGEDVCQKGKCVDGKCVDGGNLQK